MSQHDLEDVNHSAAVLVVEDDSSLRDILCWALQDEGLPVRSASNGREGLDSASRSRPLLVVLDLAMPVLDGPGFAVGLREMYGPSVPIIVVSADEKAAEKAQRMGAVEYVRKPFDIDVLVAKVEQYLAVL